MLLCIRDNGNAEERFKDMTWEITVGLFTLISAFIAVMNIVVKVNRTLTALESAVKRLTEYMEKQSTKNNNFYKQLSDHETRISILEEKNHESTQENTYE